MKRYIIKGIACLLFILAPTVTLLADDPEPPSPGGDPTETGGVPVGAPIDGGLGILLVLGAGYGASKLYRARKKADSEEDDRE